MYFKAVYHAICNYLSLEVNQIGSSSFLIKDLLQHLEQHSSLPEVDDMCHDQDKMTIEAETDNQDLILSDSDTDSLDVDTELPNYSVCT